MICCIECFKEVEYDDAVYADDKLMLCIECFKEVHPV